MIDITKISLVLIICYIAWTLFIQKKFNIQLALLLIMLFIPKINLFKINTYSSTGIRIDDIIIVILLVRCFSMNIIRNKYIKKGIIILTILSFTSLVSVILGYLKGYDNALLYSILVVIRRIEYFSLIIIGYYIGTHVDQKTIISNFNILNVGYMIVAILQLIGICGYAVSGVSSPDFFYGIAVSTFNGYYEYGAYLVFCIILYFNMFINKCGNSLQNITLLILSFIMISFTKSRTSLVSAVFMLTFITMYTIHFKKKKRIFLIFFSGLIIFLFVAYILIINNYIINDRFSTINITENLKYLIYNLKNNDLDIYLKMIKSGDEVKEILSYINETKDLSLSIRFFKWGSVLNGFINNILFGYGYGVTYVIDGNYIKLLGEIGIIGTFIWLLLLFYYQNQMRHYLKNNILCSLSYYMIISLCISALLIDMFDASKIMEYLWFYIGISISSISSNALIHNRIQINSKTT